MIKNVGNPDRIARVVLGAVAIMGGMTVGLGSVGGVMLVVVGAVLLATAAVGFCPIYRALGLRTVPGRR